MEASSEYTATSNGSSQSPLEAHQAVESPGRPELPVIGAFVAGFVFAKLLGRFGGGDD
jgi:hypothetical protein